MFPIEELPQVVARTAGLKADHEGHRVVCELKGEIMRGQQTCLYSGFRYHIISLQNKVVR